MVSMCLPFETHLIIGNLYNQKKSGTQKSLSGPESIAINSIGFDAPKDWYFVLLEKNIWGDFEF